MIKTFEITTEHKEVKTVEPIIVLKMDKATVLNLRDSIGIVLSLAKNNDSVDNSDDMSIEMVHNFLEALSKELNSTKR
jgi:hypothetical protein